jgi:mannosyltransferase
VDDQALSDLEIVIPNLHWRYSGVTATNRMIAPRLARPYHTAWLGRDAPEGIARLSFGGLLRLRFCPSNRRAARIWHARRNNEMIVGLVLKLFGWKLKLIYTSAGQRRFSRFTQFLIGRMDEVIATSDAAASYLRCPATVILHGVDADVYRPPADRAASFAGSGLPGKYGIGCFGRVRMQKGTDLFVEAMCRLLPNYPDYTAIVVGLITPRHRRFAARLLERVESAGLAGRVRFLGELPIDELPLWYQRISIYAFTSRVEGFGLTLLEAEAAGAALVAARAGAAENVVIDRETGVLVRAGDVDALVKGLDTLMRDPGKAAAMGARARGRVMAEFNVNVEAARIAEVYRRSWARGR